MKTLIAFALVAASVTGASAQYGNAPNTGLYGTGSNPNSHYVQPHITQNGTYIQGHQQTNPNNTQRDNFGTAPNINPYTGTVGTGRARY